MRNRSLVLKLIHAALTSGPILFLGVAAWVRVDAGSSDPHLATVGYAVAAGAALLSFALPKIILGKTVVAGAGAESALGKFGLYQTAKIIQWSLVEAGALLNAVVFFLSGSQISAGISVALILLMVVHRPSKQDFVKLLNIPLHEQSSVEF